MTWPLTRHQTLPRESTPKSGACKLHTNIKHLLRDRPTRTPFAPFCFAVRAATAWLIYLVRNTDLHRYVFHIVGEKQSARLTRDASLRALCFCCRTRKQLTQTHRRHKTSPHHLSLSNCLASHAGTKTQNHTATRQAPTPTYTVGPHKHKHTRHVMSKTLPSHTYRAL